MATTSTLDDYNKKIILSNNNIYPIMTLMVKSCIP